MITMNGSLVKFILEREWEEFKKPTFNPHTLHITLC